VIARVFRMLFQPLILSVGLPRLIGRERELAALTALLTDPSVRLVTLLGPGGTGKSRLGLKLATAVQAAFAEGVFYVRLAPLTDPLFALPAIASALGVRETAQRALHEILVSRLKDDRVLLVLDNFERLLPAANHIAELLSGTASQGPRDEPGAAANPWRVRVSP
jgi:predicted ATPase